MSDNEEISEVNVKQPVAEENEVTENKTTDVQGEKKSEEKKEFEEVMDSMCMQCGGTGTTRYMIHKIPYFRELVISSFDCHDEECGEHNNEVTFGGEIQLQGCSFTLEVTEQKDLDRQLIKSDSASVHLPGLDFEIPPDTQKGEISTIEGFLMTAAKNLGLFQEERLQQNPEVGEKVAGIITDLTRMAMGTMFPFTISVSDPAGNSFVQNLCAPQVDPQLKQTFFHRTREQNTSLGLNPDAQDYREDSETNFSAMIDPERSFGAAEQQKTPAVVSSSPSSTSSIQSAIASKTEDIRLGRQEVISIPDYCCNCHHSGESLTAVTDIPHFKEVIIMAFTCENCGYKSSEVKAGGAVPTYGTEVSLYATSAADLKRDVLKSDSAMVRIPELGLELQCGTLGGQYTTVEGLLQKIESNVRDINPFSVGDSTTLHHSEKLNKEPKDGVFDKFLEELKDLGAGKKFPFTLNIRDPLGNSFISAHLGSFTPPEADEALTIIDFERTFQENEDFGFNDMNTRDFETGVDYDDDHVHLADRLTHVHVKGDDHPVPFAQGVADGTQQGMFFASTATATAEQSTSTSTNTSGDAQDNDKDKDKEQHQNSGSSSSSASGWISHGPAWGPEEMAAEMGCPTNTSAQVEEPEGGGRGGGGVVGNLPQRRKFHARDKELKFSPREEFAGRREGCVFRLGGQGMGYYEDRPLTEADLGVVDASKKGSETGSETWAEQQQEEKQSGI